MKKLLLSGVIALLFFGFSADALAQRRYRRGEDGFRRNTYNDRQRIRRGVRTGRLTRDEARELRREERELRRERREARRDGLTREERREIRREEREQDRELREELRDEDRRDRRRGNGYYRRGAGSRDHPRHGRDF